MKFVLFLVCCSLGFAAQAKSKVVEVRCHPNPDATVSQFFASAHLTVDEDDTATGTFEYSTKVSHSQQPSEISTAQVVGKMIYIPAGQITKNDVISFELKSSSDPEIYIHLNSGLPTPRSSVILIDRKDRYSSECSVN